ncbi:MAG: efflux RND transporter periplasmic adaptor subunit [Acidobacteria bacterium]|nr:efflux RND transporter periplasmic adaptor subunit [Acidobacteriota bacterium]MBS1866855.1 efflux RND transporter periplasmic adaptor subunit [Acidobacteriota bacterium]
MKRTANSARQHQIAGGIFWDALAVAALACAAGCGGGKDAKAVSAQTPAPLVIVEAVGVKTIPIYGEFVGQTEAKDTVNIEARVAGFLEKVEFTEGTRIQAGQPLFQIEQAPYAAALESSQAKLAQDQASLLKSEQDVARLQPLVEQRAAPAQDLDASLAARAQYQAAIKSDQANIDIAKLNLSYTIIRSPIAGIIGRLLVTPGNLVGQGQNTQLATVSSYDPIYVYFTVPEAAYLDYKSKHPGPDSNARMPLQLILADNHPFQHKGFINFADRAVDPATGTLSLRGQFPNPEALLRPGQFARVRVVLEERPGAILVPKVAITETLNTKGVLVVGADNKVKLKTITTDGEYEQYAIVHSGLEGGEKVVTQGLQKVRPGMAVTPQTAAGGQQE